MKQELTRNIWSLRSQAPFHLVAQKSPAFIPPTVSQQGFALLQFPLLFAGENENNPVLDHFDPSKSACDPRVHSLCHSLCSLPAAQGSFQLGVQSCFQLRCPISQQTDLENLPSKSQSPADALNHPCERCSGMLEGELWLCVWQDPGQGTGRDELTHAEHHQSSSKVISIKEHICYTNHIPFITATVWMWLCQPGLGLSLSKKPLMCCTAAGSVLLPDSLPPSSLLGSCGSCSFSSLMSLDKTVPPLQPLLWKGGREGREDSQGKKMITLALLASCCRQVLCPPCPPWSCAAKEAALRAACSEKLLQGSAKPPGLNSLPEADTPLGTWMTM